MCLILQNAVSEETSPDDPNLKVVTFGTSPIMSTYLVAFVVGEFDFVESKSADGVDVRVFTPPGKKEQGDFALEVNIQITYCIRHVSRVHIFFLFWTRWGKFAKA